MCSVNAADEEQRWVPTHVQVLVMRARDLRAKGKHGTSDSYAVMQLGKEKYCTRVAEKTTEPEWGEECTFELHPGALERADGGACNLILTVMHRALIGLDVFLGQAVIPLDKAFRERICMKNEWYKLHSKTGKKEKERGELQVTVQFTRHNLTASMYDLSMKDKPHSAFEKLRERMRARKRGSDEESSSAIVPGGYGAIARVRGRLPSDGGGEEDYEDDEGGELRRSKMRSFFLRGRLRKSSDTRSSTSLGSESSESSSRGGSLSPTAGISVVVSDLSNSPSNSSNLTADNSPEHTVAPSPQVSPVKHAFDPCDLSIQVPRSLTNDDTPILLPSVCVNGNPVETSPLTHQPPSLILQQPKPQTHQEPMKTPSQMSSSEKTNLTQAQTGNRPEPKPSTESQSQLPKAESKSRPEPLLPALGLLQKGSALSLSLQNLSRRGEERQAGGPMDGRRWSFDKPGEEEKAAIAAALEHSGLVSDEPEVEVTVSETEIQSKKKRGLFSHGRGSDSAGKGSGMGKQETSHGHPPTEGKHRGWFSSKDSKPSPAHSQPETIPSCSRNLSTFPDLPNDGNAQSYSVDAVSQIGTITNLTDISKYHTDNLPASQAERHSDWDNFVSDRLKSSEMINPPPLLIKQPDPVSPYAEGDLTVSIKGEALVDNTATTYLLTVDNFSSSKSEPDSNCSNTSNTELHIFSAQGATIYESDFPQNSSIDFSELNALDCPHLAHSGCSVNQNKFSAVSNIEYYVQESQVSDSNSFNELSFLTPEVSELDSKPLDPLELTVDKKTDHETVASLSSNMLPDDTKSVETLMTSVPNCNSSDVTKHPSVLTSESLDRNHDLQVPKSRMSSFGVDESVKTVGGEVKSKESFIKDDAQLDGSLAHITAESSRLSVSEIKSNVVMEETDIGSEPWCVSFDRIEDNLFGEGSLDSINDLDVIMTSSPGVSGNSLLTKDVIMDGQPELSMGNFKVSIFSGSQIGHLEEEAGRDDTKWAQSIGCLPNLSANVRMETEPDSVIRNAVLSPGSFLFHSLYTSVDSEQYFSFRSQHNFPSVSEFSQEPSTKHDPFQEDKPCQEILPVNNLCQGSILEEQCEQNISWLLEDPDNVVAQISKPPESHLSNVCSTIEGGMPGDTMTEALQICYPTVEALTNHGLIWEENQKVMMEEHPLKSDPQTSSMENVSFQDINIITDFGRPAVNLYVSDFPSEQTSSITQDLVTTDLLQNPAMQTTDTHTDKHPVPMETCGNVMFYRAEHSHTNINTQEATGNVPDIVRSYLDSSRHCASTVDPPAPESLSLTRPTLPSACDSNSNLPFPLFDLSPIASSTPHVGVGTNTLPLSPFSKMPFTPANSSPSTVLAAAPSSPTQPVSHVIFPQEQQQVPTHLSSPHRVKPLTPPDEKKSEGRSVLEKLKSTIHPGRSHHGEQESEKKLLVEGGGSYYHLNHSELVSLLLQRDAELQKEKEEYEHRGLLLEKREVEIKKMKVLIRDLEDYIDTLLVRIMEQTPTLLQVRSKMK
ncbi:serine-rich adhesin for platelets isoform X2 [Hoplias malabaricus]|uniref:serine-rich adhesin for platelets isoform X2 n=1 Tax=Hoplias malabaricus TaxID=27720 RepID=UPI0034619447